MTISAAGATVLRRIVDIIGHLVTCVGDEVFSFGGFAFAEEIHGQTCGDGSSKGCEGDGLRSLHNRCFSP